jgi:hypothetical protein
MGVFDYDRTNIFGKIYEYTRGKIYNGNYNGDDLHLAIESMIDLTLEMIRANPSLETQENAYDMLDFTDPEERFYDEEEEDYYV